MTPDELMNSELGKAIMKDAPAIAWDVCTKCGRGGLAEDMAGEIRLFALEKLDTGMDKPYAFAAIRYHLMTLIASKRYSYSYKNQVPHFHIIYDSDYVMVDGQLHCFSLDYTEEPLPDIIDSLEYEQVLACVDDRTGFILRACSEGWKQCEIVDKIGRSRSLVSTIRKNGISKIREHLGIAEIVA